MIVIVCSKSGEKIEIKKEASVFDLASKFGIQKDALVASVNGILTDLSTTLKNEDTVGILTLKDIEGLQVLRHSTAHVLAMALQELDDATELAIGPSIENGFYYDIKTCKPYSMEDLPKIEEKMKEIIKRNLPFEKTEMSKSEAIKMFEEMGQLFKVELIKDIPSETVGIYKVGDFIDLCKGPHVSNTSCIPVDAIKLTTVAGAYWRGDSSKDVLQRIYGTVWPSKKEMDDYFTLVAEAQARDHRKLGVELGIFHIDEAAPGNIFWLQNGFALLNTMKAYLSRVIKRYGYFQVQTPQILNKSLWETSGHWEKFKDDMFVVEDGESTTMAIKPMNCPGHIIIYKTGPVKSYRDLPLRMAEFGVCHRNESSGSLHGLMRLRAFTQDDGHCFCSPDQIVSETMNICSALKEIYAAFGFTEIAVKFSDRPEKRIGSDEVWDIAEKSLKEAADAAGLKYTLNKGEGAFYGPKLEFVLKDCLGRDWQCGTIQVDFSMPKRFDISYIDKDGQKQTPVMIHRAIIGSFDRFIGILIENYAGKFPFWLAPVQIAIASVTEEVSEYASEVQNILEEKDFRTVLDVKNEKITYKIREHSMQKIPAIIILGKKEQEDKTISIRTLGSNDTITIPLAEAVEYFAKLAKTPE